MSSLNKKNICIIDLSYVMHSYKHAVRLCIDRPGLKPSFIVTSHVYMTFNEITQLSMEYDSVFLLVDSSPTKRKTINPSYKEGRRQVTGDPYMDYNIYNDLYNILTLLTAIPNVFYIKDREICQESDDIGASFIQDSLKRDSYNLSVVMNDNDWMLNKGRYNWMKTVTGKPQDLQAYINKKYGVSLTHIPIVYKLFSVDSDNIFPVFSSFPTKYKRKLCELIPYSFDFEEIWRTTISDDFLSILSPTWKERILLLKDKDSKEYAAYKQSFDLICPVIRPIEEFTYSQIKSDYKTTHDIIDYYQIRNKSSIETYDSLCYK